MDLPTVKTTDVIMQPNISVSDLPDVDGPTGPTDSTWDVKKAVRDVGYFLRGHKFQDYDRRYYRGAGEAPYGLHESFPRPALRAVHWQVRRHCDVSFLECLKYAARVAGSIAQRRDVDAATIVVAEAWTTGRDDERILAAQEQCQTAQRRDNLTMTPFQGPIERFQWRTSASYYMCWYAMLGAPELETFGEPCDNHANCLDEYGARNRDPRADDAKPFACALYSFCPDHCCPMKHLWYMNDCYQSPQNPCYADARAGNRRCVLKRAANRDLASLASNRLNVTCECPTAGHEWSSRFGLCVDVNECSRGFHDCAEPRESCANLPGTHECVCRLGYVRDPAGRRCVARRDVEEALRDVRVERVVDAMREKSLVGRIVEKFGRSSANRREIGFAIQLIAPIGVARILINV